MGGQKYKERGGGPTVGLANDTVGMLRNLLGGFGAGSATAQTASADPISSTTGISAVLSDILSGGAGRIGGSMAEMIAKDTQRQADELRARFGVGGGTSMGTPAAFAEALLRSESAPKLTQAIGGLQLQALLPMMNIIAQLSGKGITQREGFMQQSDLSNILGMALPVAGSILGGPIGGQIGGKIGSMFGGGLSGTQQMMINPTYNPATLGTIGGVSPISPNMILPPIPGL